MEGTTSIGTLEKTSKAGWIR